MFLIIAVVEVILLAALPAIAATNPGTFRVERSTRIQWKSRRRMVWAELSRKWAVAEMKMKDSERSEG
jgi:hypothetical protein